MKTFYQDVKGKRQAVVLPTGPTAPSAVSPKHADTMELHHLIEPSNSLKKLVRDTQFNRLIRGEIEPTKPEVRDMEWLFGHKHKLKLGHVTRSGTHLYYCYECSHTITRTRRQLARMFGKASR